MYTLVGFCFIIVSKMAAVASILWLDFSQFNSEAGSPALKLDLSDNQDYNGNISKLLKPADPGELKAPKF